MLRERWAQVKDGSGQMVLLSGEAGIGESRLVQVLTEQVAGGAPGMADALSGFALSPAQRLYTMIDLLERVALRFEREEIPPHKRSKLEGFLVQYGLPLAEAVPLFAALLSLPLGADYAPLTDVARAAEAADPPRPADDPAAHCGPAARPLCDGRPRWSIRSPWNCSVCWSTKAPPPASWPC